MDEDFGTPEAVAVLFELAGEVNRGNAEVAGLLKALAPIWACCRTTPRPSAGRRGPGRGRHRGADRRARGRQGGEEFRRGRPHPGRAAGPGHRAQGLAAGTTWEAGAQ
jgi:cysteinyl-tRNA synthetase